MIINLERYPPNNMMTLAALAVLATLAALVILLLYLYLGERKRRSKEQYKEKYLALAQTDSILEMLNEIFLHRTLLENQLIEYAITGGLKSNSPDEDYKKEAFRYLNFCISRLKQIMDILTDDNCCISIKLLTKNPTNPEDQEPHVITYLRDEQSEMYRGKIDAIVTSYPLSKHSPFKELLLEPSGEEIFIENDLRARSLRGAYVNINPNWRKHYNATAVAPIKNPINRANDDVLGFLCVDNWRGGMHVKVTSGILKIVASSIYYAMHTVAVFDISKEYPDATEG